jgi:secreted trypsin-like serine protease
MRCFIVICLCLSLVWGTPLQKGRSKPVPLKNIGPRIINGEVAALGQFPWQAAVHFSGQGFIWFCGGSIISEEWILTAGHCVYEAENATASTGLVGLYEHIGVMSKISDFVLHPGYNADTLENDIGLIKLKEPLKFDENQAAIALSEDFLEDGVHVTVSGWGTTSDDSPNVNPVLNYVELLIVTNDECSKYYPDFTLRLSVSLVMMVVNLILLLGI